MTAGFDGSIGFDGLDDLATRAPVAALLTDFDGTLAEIVADPSRAVPVAGATDALAALVGRLGLVGVVSGRPLAFLQDRVPIDGLVRVGQYGAEREVGGVVAVDPAAVHGRARVEAATTAAGRCWPDLRIERKGGYAVAVHWRERPTAAPDPPTIAAFAAEFALVAVPGRQVVEFRPPGVPDKGDAVRAVLAGHAVEIAAFLGDDEGDVVAFDALSAWAMAQPGRAIRVAVRSPETPEALLARADLVLDGPAAVVATLTRLGRALGDQG